MNTNQRLRELMSKHALVIKDVMRLTCTSSRSTVTGWLAAPDKLWRREMPAAKLELLELKLKGGKRV